MEQKRYFYDEKTNEVLTYGEMKVDYERFKDNQNFCNYNTDNFDDYLDALLRDTGELVEEIDENMYNDYLWELAEKDAEKELCNIHCPFNHEIECSQCEAFYAVRDYIYEKMTSCKGE